MTHSRNTYLRSYTATYEKDMVPIERTRASGNESFLRQRHPSYVLLRELDDFAPVAFGQSDMPALGAELHRVLATLEGGDAAHVTSILTMVERCGREGGCIVFAPFPAEKTGYDVPDR